jgi:hypothetical protein
MLLVQSVAESQQQQQQLALFNFLSQKIKGTDNLFLKYEGQQRVKLGPELAGGDIEPAVLTFRNCAALYIRFVASHRIKCRLT